MIAIESVKNAHIGSSIPRAALTDMIRIDTAHTWIDDLTWPVETGLLSTRCTSLSAKGCSEGRRTRTFNQRIKSPMLYH